MRNELRMDLYRLRKSKLLYVLVAITALITLIGLLGLNFSRWLVAYIENYVDLSTMNSEIVDSFLYTLPDSYTDYLCIFFSGNFATLYILIFALMFYQADYRKGYIKNTINRARRGGAMVLSRLVLTTGVTLLLYIMIAVMVTVSCMITGYFNPAEIVPLIKVFFTGILLNVAIVSFMVMLFLWWQNIVPALITGIGYVLAMGEILYYLNKPVQILTGNTDFDFNQFLCLGNLIYYNIPENGISDYLRMIGIALAVLVISVAGSIACVNRKDV